MFLVEKLPNVMIDGVDFDATVVEVGKRFFGLGEIPNLRITIADALEVIKNPKEYPLRASCYTLIIVDLYVGSNPPVALEEEGVLRGIRALLDLGGVVCFNRLSVGATHDFQAKLEGVFSRVEPVAVTYGWGLPPGNTLYLCQNR